MAHLAHGADLAHQPPERGVVGTSRFRRDGVRADFDDDSHFTASIFMVQATGAFGSKRYFAIGSVMEQIKNDIINVLQKYLEIDLEGLDIKISQTELDDNNGAVPALFANIPIKDMKAKEEESNKKNSKSKNSNNIKRTIVTNGSKDKLKV